MRTHPPILEAYKMDGTFLWRISLGCNIREGAHHMQFMVSDLNGDGKDEIVLGHSYGVRSRRKLEGALSDNLFFIWLAGGLKPDFKTIARFRRDDGPALSLIEGNTLFVDGGKFRAKVKTVLARLFRWCCCVPGGSASHLERRPDGQAHYELK